MKHFAISSLLVLIALFSLPLTSCSKDDELHNLDYDKDKISSSIGWVDAFAIVTLQNYYLWSDEPGRNELVESVLNPDTCQHPASSIKKALHSDDRWSMLTPIMSQLLEESNGTETTYGMEFTPYLYSSDSDKVFFVVRVVYAGSPAEEAGVKRGDILTRINDVSITKSNYTKLYDAATTITLGFGELNGKAIEDIKKTVVLKPIKMYEEPVLAHKVFDIEGKKVGYLCYNAFVEDMETLKSVFQQFKDEQVSELVIDLRYNRGGQVKTCASLASMIAPTGNVKAEQVFIKNVYNKKLSDVYSSSIERCFDKSYAQYNPDIKKVYAIVTEATASASEMLLIGLMPYTDVTVLGEKTHGKFCSGLMLTPKNIFKEDFYNEHKADFDDWGIYVMIGSFANKNNENVSRPNGIKPKYEVMDYPFDGYQFGDENETMLREALELAGKKYPDTRALTDEPVSFKHITTPVRSFAIEDVETFRIDPKQ